MAMTAIATAARAPFLEGVACYVCGSTDHRDFIVAQDDLGGTPVHDAMAVAHVIRGDLVQTRHVNVEVDCASELFKISGPTASSITISS